MAEEAILAYTDYPFVLLGDAPGQPAPMRQVRVIAYDGDKCVRVQIDDNEDTIKRGYLYTDETGKAVVSEEALAGLPKEW